MTAGIMRSGTEKRIAGVCGGIAQYFDVDPLLVRIAFVAAALMGWGIFVYIALWIALPAPEPGIPAARRTTSAIRIAEERYARGEISADELRRIRNEIGSAA